MLKILSEYTSVNNNIYFHHSINDAGDGFFYYKPEIHSTYEVFFLIEGTVEYNIEGEIFKVAPGEILIIDKLQMHSLKIDLENRYERFVVNFSEDVFPNLSDEFVQLFELFSVKTNKINRIFKKNSSNLRELIQILYEIEKIVLSNDKYKKPMLIGAVINLMIVINKMYDTIDKLPKTPNDSLTKRTVQFLNENLDKKLSLDDIAKEHFVSKYYLCHVFKKEMGMPINKYITLKKIQYAAYLITNGTPPMDASTKVGFDNYSSFYHNYLKIIRLPPSAFYKKKNSN